MEDRSSRLLTLVPWVLQRLLHDEYEVTCDASRRPQTLELDPDYSLFSIEEMEDRLKASPLWRSVGLERLFAIRDQLTPEAISEALSHVALPPMWLAREELLHADWPKIVAAVFSGFRRFTKDLAGAVIDSRIGLGQPHAAELESGLQWMRPDALPEAVAEYVVREMSESFPRIVERLRTFQVTPVTEAVPLDVAQYAREACRCYLHGFLSASLILCRSCVETGIENVLVQKGFRKELNAIPYNKVQEILKLALREGVLDELAWKMADEIRRSANKAAHGTSPSETTSRDLLDQTRSVLRHLYE